MEKIIHPLVRKKNEVLLRKIEIKNFLRNTLINREQINKIF